MYTYVHSCITWKYKLNIKKKQNLVRVADLWRPQIACRMQWIKWKEKNKSKSSCSPFTCHLCGACNFSCQCIWENTRINNTNKQISRTNFENRKEKKNYIEAYNHTQTKWNWWPKEYFVFKTKVNWSKSQHDFKHCYFYLIHYLYVSYIILLSDPMELKTGNVIRAVRF